MTFISSPPIAFVIYVGLVALLYGFGRIMAPAARQNSTKSSLYAGAELVLHVICSPDHCAQAGSQGASAANISSTMA